ncbi:MAG: phosphatidylglycerophosphatase A [Candidatus Riflebacteria bacterium HGW-Riflebacteria-1]|jgi:phosphatidylglycerophosphatase A|nr:MAG: phosphatidylglycerophosphatase A [Candidatus Riflebacteria bacterium HGW-Riflebacteria-1]
MTISKRIGTSWTNSSASIGSIKLLGSCFGLGYIKKAPGTLGSLPGIALFLATRNFGAWPQIGLFFTFSLIAIGISERIERIDRSIDPEEVVIDEAVGMWATLLFIWNASFGTILAGFILFRLLDILKPFPINLFQTFRGGTGIVADDLAAGMVANLILRVLLLNGII